MMEPHEQAPLEIRPEPEGVDPIRVDGDGSARRKDLRPSPGDRSPTAAIRVSGIVLLILAALAALAFIVLRGGLTYPLQPAPGPASLRSDAVVTAAKPSAETPTSPIGSPTPVASPSLEETPAPTPSPTPTATPTPPATSRPEPTPSSDRYAVLRPCPGTADCWIYTVRSGDNLFSIAHWFGVSLDIVRAMNPWTESNGIRAGDELRLPPPSR